MVRKYFKCKCNGIMQILFLPRKSDQPNARNFKCLYDVLSESLSQSQDGESDCSGSLLGPEAAPGVDIQLPQPQYGLLHLLDLLLVKCGEDDIHKKLYILASKKDEFLAPIWAVRGNSPANNVCFHPKMILNSALVPFLGGFGV